MYSGGVAEIVLYKEAGFFSGQRLYLVLSMSKRRIMFSHNLSLSEFLLTNYSVFPCVHSSVFSPFCFSSLKVIIVLMN